jgi:hypothetical protein
VVEASMSLTIIAISASILNLRDLRKPKTRRVELGTNAISANEAIVLRGFVKNLCFDPAIS